MANPWRGEVELVLNGQPHVLRLTLGALAELEAGLGEDCLVSLIARYEEGRHSTRDVIALLVAGLRGGGWQGQTQDLASARIRGGPLEASRVAAELLARAFMTPGEDP